MPCGQSVLFLYYLSRQYSQTVISVPIVSVLRSIVVNGKWKYPKGEVVYRIGRPDSIKGLSLRPWRPMESFLQGTLLASFHRINLERSERFKNKRSEVRNQRSEIRALSKITNEPRRREKIILNSNPSEIRCAPHYHEFYWVNRNAKNYDINLIPSAPFWY